MIIRLYPVDFVFVFMLPFRDALWFGITPFLAASSAEGTW